LVLFWYLVMARIEQVFVSQFLCEVVGVGPRRRIDAGAMAGRDTGMSTPEACELVRAGRVVWSCEGLAEMLATSELSSTKLRLLSRVAIPDRADLFVRDAAVFAEHAPRLEPDALRLLARRWADHADDELGRGEPKDRYERRSATFRRFAEWGEVVVRGPHADIETLRTAVDRCSPPDAHSRKGGPRSLAQRRFDGFIHLARRSLGGKTGRTDPENTVNIVIDWKTLRGGYDPDGRSETINGRPVSLATVERLLCDSWLSRVILGADGEVLDLGRRARLFSAAQKRAILLRDRGCVVCGAPPEWCDAHHLVPWEAGGATDIDNGVALCRGDHTRVHEGGWSLTRTAEGGWELVPP
jgi:hypothetical protein